MWAADLCRVEELHALVDRIVEDLPKFFIVLRVVLPEERVAPRPCANAYPRRSALGLAEWLGLGLGLGLGLVGLGLGLA